MSELYASPGPWKPDFSDVSVVAVNDANGNMILKCLIADEDIVVDQMEITREHSIANSYLSAAAPEMYEILSGILTDWPSITTDKELRISTLASIEEVLRKARGETK